MSLAITHAKKRPGFQSQEIGRRKVSLATHHPSLFHTPLFNVPLTSAIADGAFRIMGDKSPKANQKQKAQQKAKASSAAQKKNTAAAAKAAPKKK